MLIYYICLKIGCNLSLWFSEAKSYGLPSSLFAAITKGSYFSNFGTTNTTIVVRLLENIANKRNPADWPE